MQPSDNEWIGRFVKSNDAEAFTKLVKRHGPMVMAVCQSLCWTQQDSEDAYQATFLVLAKKAKKLLRLSSIGGWLHQVAVRNCLNLRRRKIRKREVELSQEPSVNVNEPWRTISEIHDREIVMQELAKLPKNYREALVLCHIEGRSRSEAAELLDCTTASIKACLARGKKLLKQRLVRHGIVTTSVLGAVATGTIANAQMPDQFIEQTVELSLGGDAINVAHDSFQIINTLANQELVGMNFLMLNKVAAVFVMVAAVFALPVILSANNAPQEGDASAGISIQLPSESTNSQTSAVQFGDANTQDSFEAEVSDSFIVQDTNSQLQEPNSAGDFGDAIQSTDAAADDFGNQLAYSDQFRNQSAEPVKSVEQLLLEPSDESIKYWELMQRASELKAEAAQLKSHGLEGDTRATQQGERVEMEATVLEQRAESIKIGILIDKLKAQQKSNTHTSNSQLSSAFGDVIASVGPQSPINQSADQAVGFSDAFVGEGDDGTTNFDGPVDYTAVAEETTSEFIPPASNSIIQPGEVLTIESLADTGLLNGNFIVMKDCTICIPLAGTISLQGMNQKQIREAIEESLKTHYKNPMIDVYRGEHAPKSGRDIPAASTDPVFPGERLMFRNLQDEMDRWVRVQADNTITFPLVGNIDVENLTPEEVTTKVTIAYKEKHYRNPLFAVLRGTLSEEK